MKTVVVILFLAIGYLAIANASPVPNRTEVKTEDAATSRQAAPAAPAVTADDDDDDDDDDDIGDLGALEEDDDDDEETEDDDDEEEEEDYLERFIDDLLGGEDDDDDDDEKPSIVEPVQPASPAQTQATALPASVQSDLNAESAAATNLAAESINDSTISYEDEDAAPEGQAVSSLEGAETAADPVILNQAAIPAPSRSIDTEDDDDEDDDDDIDLDLTEDDESDEEDGEYEEDDADEETDDLDEIADIADARRAREFKGKTKKHTNIRLRKHARGKKSFKKHNTDA